MTSDKFDQESDTTKLGRILSATADKKEEVRNPMIAWFKKLDYQHLVLIVAFLATGVLPDFVSLEHDLGLPAWMGPTAKVASALTFLVGLSKQYSAPGTPFGMKRRVALGNAIASTLFAFAVLSYATAFLIACSSCSGAKPSVSSPTVTPIDGGFQVCTVITAQLRDGGMAYLPPPSAGVNVTVVDGGLQVCTQVRAELE